jgi:DNA topoisomerase I
MTGQHVYVMHGRFGAYVQLGETPEDRDIKPRRASLGRDHTEDTITLEVALKLLSLPRELGHGDDGEPILANLGRFGPYVKQGTEFRSLEDTDDVYTVSLERAKELLAQPKKSMRRSRQAPKELKALGKHPESGEPVKILDGRYGPYVTDGTTNASVPKGMQVEAVTMASAVELLNARAGMSVKKGRGRKTAKVTAKKKAAPKKKSA